MATPNLAPSPRYLVSGTLSRTFGWRVISAQTDRTISQHQDLSLALEKAKTLNRLGCFELPACEYEIPGFGPCDAQPCGRRAIASSISLQIPVCKSCLANLEAEAL